MIAVDLFAGPGGWDVAAHWLGVDPLGIEWDDAACRGGGFRMTPAIYLREGEVATFIDGKKKVWKLPDGAIFRRRPFAIQPDLLRFADKELRSADA